MTQNKAVVAHGMTRRRGFGYLGRCGAMIVLTSLCAWSVSLGSEAGAVGAPGGGYVDYSDVECLAKAISIVGGNVNAMDLIPSLHSSTGTSTSTAALSKVAVGLGYQCSMVSHMTNWQLRNCKLPVILHIMGSPYSENADHFVLFVGTQNNEAMLADEHSTNRVVPFWQLSTRWRGEALVVSDTRQKLGSSVPQAWRQPTCIILASIGIGFPLLAMIGFRRLKSTARTAVSPVRLLAGPMAYCALLFGMSVCLGMLSSRLSFGSVRGLSSPSSKGGASNLDFWPKAAAEVAQAPLPELSVQAAVQLQESGTLFVDARDAAEYDAGHIHGAIDVPAASEDQIRFRVTLIPKDQPLVVYCALATCGKARYVAEQLQELGFTAVSIYPGGWADWPRK